REPVEGLGGALAGLDLRPAEPPVVAGALTEDLARGGAQRARQRSVGCDDDADVAHGTSARKRAGETPRSRVIWAPCRGEMLPHRVEIALQPIGITGEFGARPLPSALCPRNGWLEGMGHGA